MATTSSSEPAQIRYDLLICDPHRRDPHDFPILLLAAHVIVARLHARLRRRIAPRKAHLRLLWLLRIDILVILHYHHLRQWRGTRQRYLKRGRRARRCREGIDHDVMAAAEFRR